MIASATGEDVAQVEVRNISRRFGGVQALANVSLAIRHGTIHALLGENGAGKSTLVKILSGAERPDEGILLVRGQEVDSSSPQAIRQLGIAVVHQELSLFPDLTVWGNVFAGREMYGRLGLLKYADMDRELKQVMEDVGWRIDTSASVQSLSLGERQMVEILRAFQQQADLIILDEPNSALTNRETQALFAMVQRMRSRGRSFLLVSHRLDEVFAVADDVTILRDGRHIATRPIAELAMRDAVAMMIGENQTTEDSRHEGSHQGQTGRQHGLPTLRVGDLGDGTFRRVSFEASTGEILGFAGLEGSGVQELFSALFGLRKVRTGEMFLGEVKYAPKHPREAIKYGVAFIPADRKEEGLLMERSVGQNAVLVILDKVATRLGFVADRQIAKRAQPYLSMFRVRTSSLSTPVVQLSGGNQQKVVLAKWLASSPRVLILNDPTRGIDVGAKHEVHTAIKGLATAGITVLMWSSDAGEILDLCNRVLVMTKGHVTREYDPRSTTLNHLLLAAYGEDNPG